MIMMAYPEETLSITHRDGGDGDPAHKTLLRRVARVASKPLFWRHRASRVQRFAELSEHTLSDIGLSRSQAIGEILRPCRK
jgi:uncharacterized protein YjiS (DUF1127 family)